MTVTTLRCWNASVCDCTMTVTMVKRRTALVLGFAVAVTTLRCRNTLVEHLVLGSDCTLVRHVREVLERGGILVYSDGDDDETLNALAVGVYSAGDDSRSTDNV